jgi:hypothetical protein
MKQVCKKVYAMGLIFYLRYNTIHNLLQTKSKYSNYQENCRCLIEVVNNELHLHRHSGGYSTLCSKASIMISICFSSKS